MSNAFVYYLSGSLNQIQLKRSYGSDYLHNVMQVSKPYKQNKLYGTGLNTNYLDSILQNIQFGGYTFDSTFKWQVKGDEILNSDSITYYFSKGVGITRVIDHERKTDKWLIRYRIIKKAD